VDELRDESIDKLEAHLQENASGCTLQNAKVRREWSDLPVKQREEYIEAVLWLQSLPAKSGSGATGARSRFDDFLAVHIKQTDYIHGTVRKPSLSLKKGR
jgi:tyrosinase